MSVLPQIVLALIVLAAGLGASVLLSRLTGIRAAGPLTLIAAAPVIPHVPIGGGLSFDDLLPLLGLVLLLPIVPWARVRPNGRLEWLLLTGIAAMIAGGIISSVANASEAGDVAVLLARSAGRFGFLGAIAIAALAATRQEAVTRDVVVRAFALVGAFEAAVGLWAYFIGFPGLFGLEAPNPNSVLHGQIPGRIIGTLGSSADFIGAVFVLTIPLTLGLALEAKEKLQAGLWWLAFGMQALALLLTYTRSSLALVLVACVGIVLLARGRLWYLAPLALLVVAVAVGTPMLSRLASDVPDRFALWTSAARLFADHPVTGVGAGRMEAVARTNPDRYGHTPFGFAGNNAHNTVFLAAAELGVAGAAGSVMLNLGMAGAAAALLLRHRRRRLRPVQLAGAVAILAFLVQGMVNNLFTVATTGILASLLVGGLLLPALRDRDGEP